jgi:hypothetical protein
MSNEALEAAAATARTYSVTINDWNSGARDYRKDWTFSVSATVANGEILLRVVTNRVISKDAAKSLLQDARIAAAQKLMKLTGRTGKTVLRSKVKPFGLWHMGTFCTEGYTQRLVIRGEERES